MQEGTVKWFDEDRGYGFIKLTSTPNHKDVFLHIRDLHNSGYDTVEKGDFVEFELEEGRKGERATNLTVYEYV